MQQSDDKILQFTNAVGSVFKEMREEYTGKSINKFAREYDIDRGNLSKIERGMLNCRLATAWKMSEASGVEFVEFAKRLQNKLGKDFTLIDI